MTYIFVWYRFDIIDMRNFFNKLGLSGWHMTFQKTYMHYIRQGGSTPSIWKRVSVI
jgi:hypothetical protein